MSYVFTPADVPKPPGRVVFDASEALEAEGTAKQRLDEAKARKYEADAERAELQLAIDRKALLPRQPIRDASAVAFAMVAQSLRSLPDQLEREANLSPEQAEVIEKAIHNTCESLAALFKSMCHD